MISVTFSVWVIFESFDLLAFESALDGLFLAPAFSSEVADLDDFLEETATAISFSLLGEMVDICPALRPVESK
jgi:hypothetical protein